MIYNFYIIRDIQKVKTWASEQYLYAAANVFTFHKFFPNKKLYPAKTKFFGIFGVKNPDNLKFSSHLIMCNYFDCVLRGYRVHLAKIISKLVLQFVILIIITQILIILNLQ